MTPEQQRRRDQQIFALRTQSFREPHNDYLKFMVSYLLKQKREQEKQD